MQITKRNGNKEEFQKQKIINAINKAFIEIDGNECEDGVPEEVASKIELRANLEKHLCINVETIQDWVEDALMQTERKDIAKAYIRYRYKREQERAIQSDLEERYKHLHLLVTGKDEESNKENSNKDTRIIPTMRDYIAGFTCRELATKVVLPKDIAEAHEQGIIHFHDSDYSPVMPMSNCFSRNTSFVTSEGLKSFKDYEDGEEIIVLTPSGKWKNAVVHNYGEQYLNKVTFKKGNSQTQEIFVTKNHRWLLSDGTETTNLKVGDKLKMHSLPVEHSIEELLSLENLSYWGKGFIFGDGSDYAKCGSRIRLCGEKEKYSEVFKKLGFHVSSICDNGDVIYTSPSFQKESVNENWSPEAISLFIEGWLAADGSYRNAVSSAKSIITIGKSKDIEVFKKYSCVGNYNIVGEDDLTGETTNFGVRKETKTFRLSTSARFKWEVTDIKENVIKEDVWCLTVEDEKSFILEHGIVTGNCCLINLEDMLQNGTVISGVKINKPHSFRTACTIATQVITQVASSQYGGNTITLAHLAPFVEVSRQYLKKKHPNFTQEQIEALVTEEIKDGVQTIQYQLITMSTTNGQAPFTSVFMWINEVEDAQTKADLILIIEEVLKQRIAGVPNEQDYPITIAFPKLLYVLDDNNITPDSEYWYLTELAAECSAKRLVPDYISAKKMRELKGDVYACMGCRSFLTPDVSKCGFDNIAKALNYNANKPKYWGRFNQGVVTLNLPDIALSSKGDFNKFWEIMDERLQLCYKALMIRHNSLKGTLSDVAPILYQHGAYARLKQGETIDSLLYNNYSTISLGYAGLYECIKYMTGKSQLESKGKEFGLQVMTALNDACLKWRNETTIGFSVYGSPIEATTFKFAKCLKKRFGIIEGITDKDYITNSYHITPSQPIDAFSKLKIESEFQELSPGGAISYIETPNMTKNIPALLEVIKYIYDNIMYAEINTMTSYCHICGNTDIYMGDDLKFHCPQCGNDDYNKMNVALRICGYISTNPFNDGRAADIHDRVYHLD